MVGCHGIVVAKSEAQSWIFKIYESEPLSEVCHFVFVVFGRTHVGITVDYTLDKTNKSQQPC